MVLQVLRIAAVVYLLWLAARSWRAAPSSAATTPSARRGWVDGFPTAALNPKGLLFFLALLPPFVDPDRPATGQLLVPGGVFCALSAIIYGAVALAAGRLGARVTGSGRATNKVAAAVLIAAAVLLGAAVLIGAGPV